MGRGGIPDRWLDYKSIGGRIKGTRFVAFKVPLRGELSEQVDNTKERLDVNKILDTIPNLGLVIDLTNTSRYYDAVQFTRNGVQHVKLMVPGHVTPPENLRRKFCKIVQSFLEDNKFNDKLIGVHCTHGVNRTGFFICHHMITELDMDSTDAIKRFEKARGHRIERHNYLNELHNARKSEHGGGEKKADSFIEKRNRENWSERNSEFPPRRISQNKMITHPENWGERNSHVSPRHLSQNKVVTHQENWKERNSDVPPRRVSQNKITTHQENWRERNFDVPARRLSQNKVVTHPENLREKTSAFSPRRPSQYKEVSHSRLSSYDECGHFSDLKDSHHEKNSINPRNPFRRNPSGSVSTDFEGENRPRYKFSEEKRPNAVKNPFKMDSRLTNKDKDDYDREKFRKDVYRPFDNDKNQFSKRRRSPDHEEGNYKRNNYRPMDGNNCRSNSWRRDRSRNKSEDNFHKSHKNPESTRRQSRQSHRTDNYSRDRTKKYNDARP